MKLLRERIVNLQSGIEYLFQIRDCKIFNSVENAIFKIDIAEVAHSLARRYFTIHLFRIGL